MLTGHKYVALINNYAANMENTCKELENLTALDLFSYSLKHQSNESNQPNLKIPKSLKIYSFENGSTNLFPEPMLAKNNLLSLNFIIFNQIRTKIKKEIFFRLLLYGWSFCFASLSCYISHNI